MKKMKGLLFAFVALFAFTLALVKVNAATDYDSVDGFDYVVSTTTNTNDTATFDILPTANKTLKVDDSILGKIVFEKVVSGKFNTTNASLKVGDQWLIAVPADSEGKVEYEADSTSNGRSYQLLNQDATEIKSVQCAKPTIISFASTDIVTVNGSSYLRFGVVGGELKPTGIKITLTKGAFAATATRYEVNYYVSGEDVPFATEEVEGGKTALANPTKWGYDLKGLYTDSELTTEWNKVVTETCNVYCKFEAWDASVLGDGSKLTPELIAKAANSLPIKESTKVPNTIYTILDRVAYVDTTLTVNGIAATKALNTGGGYNLTDKARGLAFEASYSGKIRLYLNGNNTARDISLYSYPTADAQEAIETQSIKATKEEALLVEFDVPEGGMYVIGGSGTTYIFSAEFVADPAPSKEFYVQTGYNDEGTELVRGIMICKNISKSELEETLAESLLKIEIFDNDNLLLDITDLLIIADRLTNKGETYVAEINGTPYEFGVKDDTLYVVAVVAVSNYDKTGLAEEYVGHTLTIKISAKAEDAFQEIMSKTVVVQGAAGRPQA